MGSKKPNGIYLTIVHANDGRLYELTEQLYKLSNSPCPNCGEEFLPDLDARDRRGFFGSILECLLAWVERRRPRYHLITCRACKEVIGHE